MWIYKLKPRDNARHSDQSVLIVERVRVVRARPACGGQYASHDIPRDQDDSLLPEQLSPIFQELRFFRYSNG